MSKKRSRKKFLLLSLFLGNIPIVFTNIAEKSITFPTYRVERKVFQRSAANQVTIPERITFIDKLAFADYPNLSSVSFPTTLQDIENSFENCTKLISVDLSMANQLQGLNGSFKGCTTLTTVTLPESLEEIGKGTFEGCAGLTSFPEISSVRFIGDNAFKGTGLTRTPLLNRVEYIGEGAFDTGKPILWNFGEFSWIDDPVQSGEDLFATFSEATGLRSGERLSLNPTTLALTEKSLTQFPWKEKIQTLSLHPEFQSLESLKGLTHLKALEIPEGYRLSNISNSIL